MPQIARFRIIRASRIPTSYFSLVALAIMLSSGVVSRSAADEYRILGHHTGPVFALRFSPDGSELFSGSTDSKAPEKKGKVWEIPGGKEKRTFDGARLLYLSRDAQLLADVDRKKATARITDVATGTQRAALSGLPDYFQTLAFSPDNKIVAISGDVDESKTVVVGLWEIASGRKLREFSAWKSSVYALAFSPDGKELVTGSWDCSVRIWDPATGLEKATLSPPKNDEPGIVEQVAFSPDGRFIAASRHNMTVWDAKTHKLLHKFPFNSYGDPGCLIFSDNGKYLAAGGAYEGMAYWLRGWLIDVWDVESGKVFRELKGPIGLADKITRLAFSPDGKQLAFGSFNGLVGLIDMSKPK